MASPRGTIIVTGVAGGIGTGWLYAHLLSPYALSHHTIYIIHPSAPGNLKATLDSKAPSGHEYEILPLDLSKQKDIKSTTRAISERIARNEIPRISLLLLIAGAMFLNAHSPDGQSFTEDGLESSFAVNYIANYMLVQLLLPSMDKEWTRIIFIGSSSHNPAFASNSGAYHKPQMKTIFHGDFEALAKGRVKIEKGDEFPAAVRRYGASKLCMTMFMYETNRTLKLDPTSHIRILAYDPGIVGGTELTNTMPWPIRLTMQYLLIPLQFISVLFSRNGTLRTPTVAGQDLAWCCWSPEVHGGEYWDGRIKSESSPESIESEKWRILVEQTGNLVQQ